MRLLCFLVGSPLRHSAAKALEQYCSNLDCSATEALEQYCSNLDYSLYNTHVSYFRAWEVATAAFILPVVTTGRGTLPLPVCFYSVLMYSTRNLFSHPCNDLLLSQIPLDVYTYKKLPLNNSVLSAFSWGLSSMCSHSSFVHSALKQSILCGWYLYG